MKMGISKFKEMPQTRAAWITMYLGLATTLMPLFLGILMTGFRHVFDKTSLNSENTGLRMGFGPSMIALILAIPTLITGIRALKKGERSWVLWAGFIPVVLVIGFLLFFIIGEFVSPH